MGQFTLTWSFDKINCALSLFGLCSLTDKVAVFGTVDGGSIPSRGTFVVV